MYISTAVNMENERVIHLLVLPTEPLIGLKCIINNAHDAYKWCSKHFTLNTPTSKREFVYVDKLDVKRN